MDYKHKLPSNHRGIKNYKEITEEELNYLYETNPFPLFGRKF